MMNVKTKRQLAGIAGLLLLVIGLPVSLSLIKNITQMSSKAAVDDARIYFLPTSAELTVDEPNTTVSLVADVKTNQLTFFRIVMTYDKNKIRLISEPETSSPFDTIIYKTSVAEASNSGEIKLVLAVSPQTSPPTGIIKITDLAFEKLSTTANDSTKIVIVPERIQLVNSQELNINTNVEEFIVFLNPTTEPTGVPTSTNTPVPAPIVCCTGKPVCTGLTTQAECSANKNCTWSCTITPTPISNNTPTPTTTAIKTPTPPPTPTPTLIPTPTPKPLCSTVSGVCKTRCIGKETVNNNYSCSETGYVCCTK